MFVGHYKPAYKAGGPIQSISNLVDRLGAEYRFHIITSDRDLNDNLPFPDIRFRRWKQVDGANVYYTSAKEFALWTYWKISNKLTFDVIYLNSLFSYRFSILPAIIWRFFLKHKAPLVIATRGELSPGALEFKKLKKLIYLKSAKILGLYNNVHWQASSVHEKNYIQEWFGESAKIQIANNLAASAKELTNKKKSKQPKAKGFLKIVFLSRISRKKNLDTALKMLNGLIGKVEFNIYGPKEDLEYWAECQDIARNLPNNITVKYCGAIGHDKVRAAMIGNDIFFFPTLGENYGHVILEALCAGNPVLISDQTPWLELEAKGVGWDLPLDNPLKFTEVLQKCIDMDNTDYSRYSHEALSMGLNIAADDHAVEQHRQLFSRKNKA